MLKLFREIKLFFNDNPRVFIVTSYLFIAFLIVTWGLDIFRDKILKLDYVNNYPNLIWLINSSSWLSKLLTGIYISWEFFDKQLAKGERIIFKEQEAKYNKIKKDFGTVISELKHHDISIKKQCRDILKYIFEKYGLDCTCRISLFYTNTPSRNPNKFYIMERFSTGGQQSHFKPDKEYDISRGVLKLIWMNEIYKDSNNCPEYKDTGKQAKKKRKNLEYEDYQKNIFNLTEQDINNQKMKSCDFLGIRFSSENDVHIIILIESRKKGKLADLKEQSINTYLKSSYIVEYLLYSISFIIWLMEKRKKYTHTDDVSDKEIQKSELMNEYHENRG